MPTLAEYFETEARLQLGQLETLLGFTPPDAAALLRAARALRGTAQMAREERTFRAALGLESALRALAAGTLEWSEWLQERTRAAVADLRVLAEHAEPDRALEERLSRALEGWAELGLELPAGALRARAGHGGASTGEFRAYVADEAEGVAAALDEGIAALQADPMDREPVKAILRRQRALLGAARLDDVPVVAEILRAIEDLTRVIAKLDVGVKQEWLDVFRIARDGLRSAIDPLRADQEPGPSNALARLRHTRAELLERYGAGETVNPAAREQEGLVQAQRLSEAEAAGAAAPAPPATGPTPAPAAEPAPATPAAAVAPPVPPKPPSVNEVVPIESLVYRGDAAARRALELRAPLDRAAARDPELSAVVDELFDLIRLARE